MLKVKISWFFWLCLLSLTACVTINVYFPVAAAEKAADEIIDKVWGEKPQPADQSEPTAPLPSESLAPRPLVYWLSYGFDMFISPAHARANLDISSQAIQTIQTRMRKRHRKLSAFYSNGVVGLTNNALIILRDPSKIPLRKRRNVKKWVNDENKDRLSLYRQIAQANGHPEWEPEIRKTFAKRWIDRASRGWWYQNSRGQWQQR